MKKFNWSNLSSVALLIALSACGGGSTLTSVNSPGADAPQPATNAATSRLAGSLLLQSADTSAESIEFCEVDFPQVSIDGSAFYVASYADAMTETEMCDLPPGISIANSTDATNLLYQANPGVVDFEDFVLVFATSQLPVAQRTAANIVAQANTLFPAGAFTEVGLDPVPDETNTNFAQPDTPSPDLTDALVVYVSTFLPEAIRTADNIVALANAVAPGVPLMAGDINSIPVVDPLPGAGNTIPEIQGASHISPLVNPADGTPLEGNPVSGVPGVVTQLAGNGFYMQDPVGDGDPDTSDGIFVFTGGAPTVAVGDSILVAGDVIEFRPGCGGVDFICAGDGGEANLAITQLTNVTITPVSSGNPLPDPVVLGVDRIPPNLIVTDDSGANIELDNVYDPANDGIDFYESLEGMRVEVNQPIVLGPTDRFDQFFVAPTGVTLTPQTTRGGVFLDPPDFNPEILEIAGDGLQVNAGDLLNDQVFGVIDYSFGRFELLPDDPSAIAVTTPTSLTPETTTLIGSAADQLKVATYNVLNLDPTDPQSKFDQLAADIATRLDAPDIIALQEVQDNSGPANDGTVDADQTLQALINAIVAAGGPTYQFSEVAPLDDSTGGQPVGNIRVAFLFNPARVSLPTAPGGAGDANTDTTVNDNGGVPQLQLNPGLIDPMVGGPFDDSRRPLVGEFVFNGETVFVVGVHLNSKSGDEPIFGRFQPPTLTSETERLGQVAAIATFVNEIFAIDANANVIVLGDTNDFEFSAPIQTLATDAGLTNLVDNVPQNDRFTFVFGGTSQVLDNFLVSPSLNASNPQVDIVHVNSADFANGEDEVIGSDHDPIVATFTVGAPAVPIPVTPPVNQPAGQIQISVQISSLATPSFMAGSVNFVASPIELFTGFTTYSTTDTFATAAFNQLVIPGVMASDCVVVHVPGQDPTVAANQIALSAACSFNGGGGDADLILTGVVDGPLTGGTPKAIELFAVNAIPDLSIYGVESANNGAAAVGPEFTLSGSATAGEYIYIATETPNFNAFFGFDPGFLDNVANNNGDDVVILYEDGTQIDVFGEVGDDTNLYGDGWAYRNDTTGPDGNTFVLGNWSFSGITALDGETTNDTADTPFPIGTYSN